MVDRKGAGQKHYAHCLSCTSAWAVFIVVITGLYKGWIGLGESLKPLENTQWDHSGGEKCRRDDRACYGREKTV
jgi:hypothetical protein